MTDASERALAKVLGIRDYAPAPARKVLPYPDNLIKALRIDGLSADGTMCHVVDSAPSATFRYLDGVSPSVLDPETGAYLPAEKPTDLPGVCYCLQTHDYDGAEYWLPLAYAARRGLRLIQPKGE